MTDILHDSPEHALRTKGALNIHKCALALNNPS